MKKVFFVLVCVLLVTVVFAYETITIYTNEGTYDCEYIALSGYELDEQLSIWRSNIQRGWSEHIWMQTLSSAQWECVQKVLGLYRIKRGDAFRIILKWDIDEPYYNRTPDFEK